MTSTRTHTFEWSDPALCIAGVEGRTGLEYLLAIIAGQVPQAPISATLEFYLVGASERFARFECMPSERLLNPMGTLHGGVMSTLLDSAMAAAVLSALDAATAYTTAQLSVNLTRAGTLKSGRLVAEGRVVHLGGKLATAEGKLVDDKGNLLAHGTTTCLLMPRK